jgi:DNA-binding transcriptional MerR regulator
MATATATSRGLRVGALATAASVTADAVCFYERVGLLPPPQRTPAGYRVYHMAALDRLRFIQGSQRLGLRLRQIRDLLTVRDTGVCPCEPCPKAWSGPRKRWPTRWRRAGLTTESGK